MEIYKEKIKNIYKIIEKIDSLILAIKKNNISEEILNIEDINMFFHAKDNFILTNNLITYFYNIYYMNYYDYLTNLNNLIDLKINYLKE